MKKMNVFSVLVMIFFFTACDLEIYIDYDIDNLAEESISVHYS